MFVFALYLWIKLSFSRVSTTVELHHLDLNKILQDKAQQALHNDAACRFEQILEVAPYKTTVGQLLTSHLANYLRKTCRLTRQS